MYKLRGVSLRPSWPARYADCWAVPWHFIFRRSWIGSQNLNSNKLLDGVASFGGGTTLACTHFENKDWQGNLYISASTGRDAVLVLPSGHSEQVHIIERYIVITFNIWLCFLVFLKPNQVTLISASLIFQVFKSPWLCQHNKFKF